MKNLKILFSISLVVMLFSCNNKSKNGEIDAVAPEKNESGYEQNETEENELTVENPPLEMSSEKADTMYRDLNMTKDQIYSFETQYKEKVEKAQDSTNSVLGKVEKDKLMHDAFKEVLSKEQLAKFEAWQRENL